MIRNTLLFSITNKCMIMSVEEICQSHTQYAVLLHRITKPNCIGYNIFITHINKQCIRQTSAGVLTLAIAVILKVRSILASIASCERRLRLVLASPQ
jgi:hypothetical protein